VTLLPPLKQITALKLSKLSIFAPQPKIPTASEPDPLPPTPSEILEQIGSKLRQLREHHHLSIEDLSARTQIQPRLIQAIEEGHIEMLPESVYVKGMVKRYGDSLGLDGMAISHQVPKWEPEAATFEPVTRLQHTGFSPAVRIKPLHVYLGYALAIFAIGAGTSHLLNDAIKPQYSTIGGAAIQPQRVVKSTVATAAHAPGVQIGIVVKTPTWAQIGIDGTTKFTGNLKVGMKFNWIANKQVTISTNNAGGLLFSRDRQPLQPLGKIGQKQNVTIKVGG
jgi:transcriptional regulator with XRE-family HTH domain